MVAACDELERITRPVGGEGYSKDVYDKAMKRADPHKGDLQRGRSSTAESRWREARIDGLVPREQWIPVETRGKGWNYDWKRPETKS